MIYDKTKDQQPEIEKRMEERRLIEETAVVALQRIEEVLERTQKQIPISPELKGRLTELLKTKDKLCKALNNPNFPTDRIKALMERINTLTEQVEEPVSAEEHRRKEEQLEEERRRIQEERRRKELSMVTYAFMCEFPWVQEELRRKEEQIEEERRRIQEEKKRQETRTALRIRLDILRKTQDKLEQALGDPNFSKDQIADLVLRIDILSKRIGIEQSEQQRWLAIITIIVSVIGTIIAIIALFKR